MGLEDSDALTFLREAITPLTQSDAMISKFYTCWFTIDDSVREMFPADMAEQREMFARALDWAIGEFIAQRADEPIAFLAQLGRDHRKYGVNQSHYESLAQALYATLTANLEDEWTDAIDEAARQVINLVTGVMSGAADAEDGPGWWEGTVVEHNRVSRDLAVIRLYLDKPLPYHPGQYVNVEIPQVPRKWRYLSPAIPSQDDGAIEFPERAVYGGIVSNAMVAETRVGDRWRLSSAHGELEVDRDGGDVLMVAGSSGLAPLRSIIMDMTRFGVNPRVHLFFGARYPCELYDLRTLWELTSSNPWLSVTPVSEYSTDPPWAGDYPDVQPPRGIHVRQKGLLPEVVTRYGGWGDRQILISGGPPMVQAVRAALLAKGAPPDRIQHDPLAH